MEKVRPPVSGWSRVKLLLVVPLKRKVKISESLLRTAVNLKIYLLLWLLLHTDVFGKHFSAVHFTQGAGALAFARLRSYQ